MLAEALSRMPHEGPMQLLQSILRVDAESICCRATSHEGEDHPLRLNGVLHATALLELGAQTAAAHASLFGLGRAHTGLVLAVSAAEFTCARVTSPAVLTVAAKRLDTLSLAASYHFEVRQAERLLVSSTVLLSMLPVQP